MTSPGAPDNTHFEALTPGQADYWRKMAAPRARVAMITGLLQEWNPNSVIDLGCGGGNLLVEVAASGANSELVGLDLSKPQIERNRATMENIEWGVTDLTAPDSLPETFCGRFDVVISSEVIEHVSDALGLLKTAYRVAVPGGRLVLSTQTGKIHETQRHVGHVRHFSTDDITALLSETGWVPDRVWNCGFPFHALTKYAANLGVKQVMHQFSEQSYGRQERFICWLTRLAYRFNSRKRGTQLYAIAYKP